MISKTRDKGSLNVLQMETPFYGRAYSVQCRGMCVVRMRFYASKELNVTKRIQDSFQHSDYQAKFHIARRLTHWRCDVQHALVLGLFYLLGSR